LVERFSEERLIEIWETSRANWHKPQLPRPIIDVSKDEGSFPFNNYNITVDETDTRLGFRYLENLFDHLIVHYLFCPRSLEVAGQLVLAAMQGLNDYNGNKDKQHRAKLMVNLFSDIVVDTFRLERSEEDEEKVLLGWTHLAEKDLSPLDKAVIGFLGRYWDADLPRSDLPQVDMLCQIFSWGVDDKTKWLRQCQQMARTLEALEPGILGKGEIRSVELLSGNAHVAPLTNLASELEPSEYKKVLSVMGLQGNLKRWYRDQSYNIIIKPSKKKVESWHPSGLIKWRFTDPPSELDVPYSFSLSPVLIPGVTTYKRELECCNMSTGGEKVPDLMVVLDSSGSMGGHGHGTKTHSATLAAFKAAQFAHSQGAELAALNFSDRLIVQEWTRDLNKAEEVMVKHLGSRTHIPGAEIQELARAREGCLILCITDTHIQNLYSEWKNMQVAAQKGQFVLFCIDEANKNLQVEGALSDLGTVYYINKLDDLISLVIETTEIAYKTCQTEKCKL